MLMGFWPSPSAPPTSELELALFISTFLCTVPRIAISEREHGVESSHTAPALACSKLGRVEGTRTRTEAELNRRSSYTPGQGCPPSSEEWRVELDPDWMREMSRSSGGSSIGSPAGSQSR